MRAVTFDYSLPRIIAAKIAGSLSADAYLTANGPTQFVECPSLGCSPKTGP